MVNTDVLRTVTLPPDPTSPARAREVLREALGACDHDDWRDAAELALTELTTNAVLHAVTEVTIRIFCSEDLLRIEVEDGSAAIPQQRGYGATASTGRGLGIVAAVALEHGCTRTPNGKIVWFTLGAEPVEESPEDLDALLEVWLDEEDRLELSEPAEGPTATLVGLPPLLWLAAMEMHDALLRELALYRVGRGLDTTDLSAAHRARFAVHDALDRVLADARAESVRHERLPVGHPAVLESVPAHVDVTVATSPQLAADAAVLQDVLDEANGLAAAGQLLTRPALPEVVALRDWVAEQLISAASGQAPMVWPGADAEHFAEHLDASAQHVDYDVASAVNGPRTAIVIDASNRVLGISSSLAARIGWEAGDLVGRRVVAIVPPRFREAHVSGFTRHLSTGQARALRVELQLPVLCADGQEVVCDFFIDDDRTQSGQPVYIAYVSPAAEVTGGS